MNPSPQQMVDLASRLQSGAGDPAAADSSPNWEGYKRWVGARLPMDTWMGPDAGRSERIPTHELTNPTPRKYNRHESGD
jgi:hypothetical protein